MLFNGKTTEGGQLEEREKWGLLEKHKACNTAAFFHGDENHR
jgi:hypothetical protein